MIRGLFSIAGGAMVGLALAILTDPDVPLHPFTIALLVVGAIVVLYTMLTIK